MVRMESVVWVKRLKISWKISAASLPQNLRAIMFPTDEQTTTTPEPQAKKRRKIGMGAYVCADAMPMRPLEYLALAPPASAALPVAQAVEVGPVDADVPVAIATPVASA